MAEFLTRKGIVYLNRMSPLGVVFGVKWMEPQLVRRAFVMS